MLSAVLELYSFIKSQGLVTKQKPHGNVNREVIQLTGLVISWLTRS